MVIHGLCTWCHYLQGSPFPVQVCVDHTNLTYFHQPQNLNCHQAQWLLDLADFDLKMIHVPGCLLSTPDTLSCHPDLLPADDNNNSSITLLPDSLFVKLINTSLSLKLAASSVSNPIVLTALQSMSGEIPSALQSRLSNWQYDTGILTF